MPTIPAHAEPGESSQQSTAMVLNQVQPCPILDQDDDNFTIYPAYTPPATVISDTTVDNSVSGEATSVPSSVPWPKSTFIIRSKSSGKVLTLLDGQVILTQAGTRGSIHWECIETKGLFGFRNTVSRNLLGHDTRGNLCCSARRHNSWEYFEVRSHPGGGYVLLVEHWGGLWHVGTKDGGGSEILAKIGEGGSGGIIWEFTKV